MISLENPGFGTGFRHCAAFPGWPQRLHQPPAVERDTNGSPSYEVEAVLAQRGKGVRRELLVRWCGYGAGHDEWRPRSVELTRLSVEEKKRKIAIATLY
jgi:hypothetical protein